MFQGVSLLVIVIMIDDTSEKRNSVKLVFNLRISRVMNGLKLRLWDQAYYRRIKSFKLFGALER